MGTLRCIELYIGNNQRRVFQTRKNSQQITNLLRARCTSVNSQGMLLELFMCKDCLRIKILQELSQQALNSRYQSVNSSNQFRGTPLFINQELMLTKAILCLEVVNLPLDLSRKLLKIDHKRVWQIWSLTRTSRSLKNRFKLICKNQPKFQRTTLRNK